MRLYDVFLRTGGAQGGRRTLGHTGEARLKGRENCEESKGDGTRAFVIFPSVGVGKGHGSWAGGELPCLGFRVAENGQFGYLGSDLTGRAQ